MSDPVQMENEETDPIQDLSLIRQNSIRKACHRTVEQDDDGNMHFIKVQVDSKFFTAFNEVAIKLLERCLESARADDRTTLKPRDLPVDILDILEVK